MVSCFDPTYKGWKPVRHALNHFGMEHALILPTRDGNYFIHPTSIISIFRFDPTYKGWKREKIKETKSKEYSFDPTYKGWKLGISADVYRKNIVL